MQFHCDLKSDFYAESKTFAIGLKSLENGKSSTCDREKSNYVV